MTTDVNLDAIMVLPNAANQRFPLRVDEDPDLDPSILLQQIRTQINRFSDLMAAVQPRFPELLIAEVLQSLKIINVTISDERPTTGTLGDLFYDTSQTGDVVFPEVHDGTNFVTDKTLIDVLKSIAATSPQAPTSLNIV